MSEHIRGGKFRMSPSVNVNEVIKMIVSIASKSKKIKLIAAKKNRGVGGGAPKVRFTDIPDGFLLTVREIDCVQEVRICCLDIPETRLEIARALRDRNIPICFKH